MVGLADLKKHFENVKKCNMTLSGEYCYFNLGGVTTLDFMDVLNYKSWVYKTFQKMVNIRYVYIIKKLEKGNTIVRTSVGFAPILLRFLKLKGFQIREEDIEVFKARIVVFPDFRINLYDFQERMVNDWLSTGGIGVIKSPTGSGKCSKGNTLILTDRGLIKVEDIVHGISDSTNKDKDIGQLSLYDCIDGDDEGSRYLYDENIKSVSNVIGISQRLKYERYKICGKYDMGISDVITLKTSMGYEISGTPEHKIVVIDNNGNLSFKRLENITSRDYIAISYNTNIFNGRLELHYSFRPSKFGSNSYVLKNIKYMNSDIARLVGYVIAEGSCIYDDNTEFLSISNYDRETIDDIIDICEKIGAHARCDYEEGKNEGNPIGVKISSKMIIGFMHYLGYRHIAKNKEVPWAILQSDRGSQISFIRAMFDSDGTVYYGESDNHERTKTKSLVEYYSSSYELCRQLQIMLLNMGIISRLNVKKGASLEYRGEIRHYEKSYRLSMTGGEILKFAELIGFGLSRKREILRSCVEDLESRDRWTDVIYPNIDKKLKVLYERLKLMGKRGEIIKTWDEDFDTGGKSIKITRRKNVSLREHLISFGFYKPIWAYITGERSPSKETLEKILRILSPTDDMVEHKYLKVLSERFIFDNVEDIKDEKEKVYDLTIDDVHSYIGNGIVNHNTIIGCNAIKMISRKTLILVHTSDLLVNVWNDSLMKSFGPGIMGQIGIIGGGLTDQDRVEMRLGVRSGDFDENVRKDIVIATFQTLMNRLDKLTQYKFGLMICDEVHHVPSNMFRKVNSVIRAPYKLGLSATLERLDGMTKGIYGQLGDVQSKVSIRELINRGILAEPRFQSPIIVDRGIIDSIQDSGLSGLNYSRLVKKKSASSQKKKDFVVNICKNIAARDRKFLLFTDYVNAEDVFVRDMYADSLLKEGTSVSVIDQGMTSDERSAVFNFLEKGDINGIIFGKLGSEGVNIPSVDVVVMANAIKCVSGDTPVPTDKGIVRAEDLEAVIPNSAFTIDPDSRSATTAKINEFYHFDEEDTIRVRTLEGYEIEGSLSHRVATGWSFGNIMYTSLSDIDIGSSVLICKDIYEEDKDQLIFYDRVISKKKGRNKLYDMNIDIYHSFIAGGFINHNSPITFTQRVGRAMRRIPGKDWCDVYEVLLDLPTEAKWSHFNFAEYQAEGFQKLTYKVE
jgi:superfamily II DNA or RNA helicase/intein/homing endonuclease